MSRSFLGASFLVLSLCGLGAGAVRAAPTPKMLLEVTDLSGPAISPDGATVAFREVRASVERNTYDSAWYVAPLEGAGGALRIADGGVPLRYDFGGAVNAPPRWSPDSRWIYYRALFGGQVQVWRAARDGSRTEAVTHDGANVDRFVLSHDGRSLLYAVGADRAATIQAEDAEYDAGVRIDETIPIGQGLYHSIDIDGRLSSARMSGDWSTRLGLLAGQPARRRIVDLATLAVHDASDAEIASFANEQTPPRLPAQAPGGEDYGVRIRAPSSDAVAFFDARRDTQALRVAASPTATNAIDCPAPVCRQGVVAAFAWRPDHDQIVFSTSDRERGRAQSLHLWDLPSGAVTTIVQGAGLLGAGQDEDVNESCAIGAVFAVCVTAAADVPPQLVRINLETGEQKLLDDPNTALGAAIGPRAQLLSWTDRMGNIFTGEFFPPVLAIPGAPAPLFITYYSCPGYLRGGAGNEWPLASFAGAGIGALCINEASGSDRFHPDQLARYQTALSGVQTIVDRLSRQGLVDPTRVGMGGLSFGSEVVFWTAMRSHLLAAASVSSTSATPSYYRFHSLQGPFLGVVKSMWGLGAPDETPERWKLLSPVFNIDRIRAPLLIQMPEQEYLQALDYFVPLAKSPTPTDLYVFPNEPHQKVQPRHKLAVYERNLDWFRFWLQDYVDPDPAKATQYRLWTDMRARAQAAGQQPGHGEAPAP